MGVTRIIPLLGAGGVLRVQEAFSAPSHGLETFAGTIVTVT
jgi:hypothetical protein